jgi:mevalonate kinase
MLFSASAPGSLMLLGEYAVMHGKHALVCAVNKRMTVKLSPRSDQLITIQSALGQHQVDLKKIKITAPFQFVLTTLKQFKNKFPSGCDIQIESEFSDKIGFASSAAVTVALLAALDAWLNLSFSKEELALTARAIVRKVQGLGSGADVAACVFGGVVGYRAQPFWVQSESVSYPISVVYSGSKTPTVEAVKRVRETFQSRPKIFKQLCRAIDECSLAGINAVQQKEWENLGKIMQIQQGIMDALGVNTPELDRIIREFTPQSDILGAKISGSGFGDCVVALGKGHCEATQHAISIPVEITPQGVRCEKS